MSRERDAQMPLRRQPWLDVLFALAWATLGLSWLMTDSGRTVVGWAFLLLAVAWVGRGLYWMRKNKRG